MAQIADRYCQRLATFALDSAGFSSECAVEQALTACLIEFLLFEVQGGTMSGLTAGVLADLRGPNTRSGLIITLVEHNELLHVHDTLLGGRLVFTVEHRADGMFHDLVYTAYPKSPTLWVLERVVAHFPATS